MCMYDSLVFNKQLRLFLLARFLLFQLVKKGDNSNHHTQCTNEQANQVVILFQEGRD